MDLETFLETPSWEWPEDADLFFLSVLEDKKAPESDRILAAELAGDMVVINDKLAEVLLSLACSPEESEEMRGRAAISLGPVLENAFIMEFDDPEDILISEETFHRIEKKLKDLFMDAKLSGYIRRMALEAAVRSPQDWQRGAVKTAYAREEKDWKLTAVFCMRFVRGFEKQILNELRNPDPDIQYQAVQAAGIWEIKEAETLINLLLVSPGTEKELLLAAIEAVATICPEKAPFMLDHLLFSDDEDVIEAVHETLSMAEALSENDDDMEDDDED